MSFAPGLVSVSVDRATGVQTLTLKSREWVRQGDGRKVCQYVTVAETRSDLGRNQDGTYPTPGLDALALVRSSNRFGDQYAVEWVGRGYWVQPI